MIITNKGEIDINALLLLGASTKREDSTKIGYFGSGLKYALAVFIRNGFDIKIFSGLSEIKLSTEKTTFRGMDFDKLLVNGVPTGITTSLGADWELWQAFREIYCNAIDEGEHTITSDTEAVPEKGLTKIIIEPNTADALYSLQGIVDNWNDYFSDRRTDIVVSNSEIKIFQGGKHLCLYRKGIRAYDTTKESLYDYDFNTIDINESRIIKYSFHIYEGLAKYWAKYATKNMVLTMFNAKQDEYFEWDADWYYSGQFNQEWLAAINGKKLIPHSISGYFIREQADGSGIVIKDTLAKALKKCFKDGVHVMGPEDSTHSFVKVEKSPRQAEMIQKSLDFFRRAEMPIEYPIEVVIFNDVSIMGHANDGTIYISVKTLEQGLKYTLSTILEESLHLESGCSDETRSFQNHIINKIVTLLEDKIGVIV